MARGAIWHPQAHYPVELDAAFAVFSGLNFVCCASGSCSALSQAMVCCAFGVARGPSLLRVMELSALLVRSQKQNEGKEKIMKTLQDTVEILVCFPLIWETAQCLLPSRSTQSCGFLSRRSGRDATCRGTSGTLPECSLCVWHSWSQSRRSSGRGAADSSGVFLRGCTKAVVPGIKVP